LTRRRWTRDEHGQPVDWSSPPYRTGSIVSFLLATERPADVDSETFRARILEYYRLLGPWSRRRGRRSPHGR